jgi:hypothetical protein
MPLCEEVMLSFAAENEARMEAMIAARSNVVRKLDELVASFRRLRQEEITREIIELLVGSVSAAIALLFRWAPCRSGVKFRDFIPVGRSIGDFRSSRPQ